MDNLENCSLNFGSGVNNLPGTPLCLNCSGCASPSILKVDLDRQFLRLSNEQKGLLDYIEEQEYATIQGAAGTGKTVVALEAAKRFADQGRKVLFLCYNSFLYDHLRDDCAYNNVEYLNIHA